MLKSVNFALIFLLVKMFANTDKSSNSNKLINESAASRGNVETQKLFDFEV